MQEIERYFPQITAHQKQQFARLKPLYEQWNAKINVISRKDIDDFYTHHVLHSLGIAKVQSFEEGSQLMDVGTGGGFPGIPLAILFPQAQFLLVDSIGKKITVVKEISRALGLKNIETFHGRVEQVDREFDFIVSRAVTQMPKFVGWVRGKIRKKSTHQLANGILYLKGGDLQQELEKFPQATQIPLSNFFQEPFFETKKVVHLPL